MKELLSLVITIILSFFKSPSSVPPPSPTPVPAPVTVTPIPSPTRKPVTVTAPAEASGEGRAVTPSRLLPQYPGSTFVSEGVYQSTDSPTQITAWYKDQINQMKFNVKTFVQTSANEKVLNKLVASNGKTEVYVEISKNPPDSQTTITLRP